MLVVVILLAVLLGAGVVLIRLWRHGFPEHRRASSRSEFDCQLPPGVIVQRLLACAGAQRDWRVEEADPKAIRIRAGTTLFAWRKRIEVSVRATTDVTSTVSIVSSSPQIYDWGDNRRAVDVLRASVGDAIWPV